jgi:hypothetical protein
MKYLIAALLFSTGLFSNSAMASWPMGRPGPSSEQRAPVAPPPKISCELDYSKSNPDGTNAKFIRGPQIPVTENGAISAINGFVMSANLRRICAADGGPCSDSFNLELKVTQVQKESFMIVTVGKGLPSQRYLTGLGVDDEEVSLMCDIGGD